MYSCDLTKKTCKVQHLTDVQSGPMARAHNSQAGHVPGEAKRDTRWSRCHLLLSHIAKVSAVHYSLLLRYPYPSESNTVKTSQMIRADLSPLFRLSSMLHFHIFQNTICTWGPSGKALDTTSRFSKLRSRKKKRGHREAYPVLHLSSQT